MLNQVNANPGAFGFSDVTDPVWTGNLTDPGSGTLRAAGAAQNQFLYFDSLHPTSQAHALLASGIAQGLTGGCVDAITLRPNGGRQTLQ